MERFLEFILNHYFLSLAFLVVLFLLIQDFVESAFRKFKLLSPLLVVAKMNNETTTILDVREENEFAKGHIENAINIPLSKLDQQLTQIKGIINQPIIAVCQTGARSSSACRTLCKNGFSQVFNMTGGMQAWEDSKLPLKTGKK